MPGSPILPDDRDESLRAHSAQLAGSEQDERDARDYDVLGESDDLVLGDPDAEPIPVPVEPESLERVLDVQVVNVQPAPPADSESAGEEEDGEDAGTVRIPSLLERFLAAREAGLDLGDPSIAFLIPAHEAMAFSLGHGIEADDARWLAAGEVGYDELIRRGWLVRIGRFVDMLVPHRRDAPPAAVLTPVAEIHCPHVPGCEASYTRTKEGVARLALAVTLRGIHAGGGLARTKTIERTIRAEAACKRMLANVLVSGLEYTHRLLPRWSLVVHTVEQLEWYTADELIQDGNGHACGPHFDHARAAVDLALQKGWRPDQTYRLHQSAGDEGALEESVEVSTARSFRFSAGVVEVQSRFTRTARYAYHLPDGGSRGYLGHFAGEHAGAFVWSW